MKNKITASDRDFKNFESDNIKFNLNYSTEDSLDFKKIEVKVIPNDDNTLFQVYLVSDVSSNPIMLPVLGKSPENALVETFNVISNINSEISDFLLQEG